MLGEELNYRRAAERLFITQPALSTAIKAARAPVRRGAVHPQHPRGRADRPRRGLAAAGAAGALAASTPPSRTSSRCPARATACIRLGYLIGTGADLLFRLVRHFEAAYPEITVEPMEFDFADPTAGLADGTTEVAIIRPPVDLPDHRMLMLDAEDWVACLPRDHRLAERAEVSITELLDDPIVVRAAAAPAGGATTGWRWTPAGNGRRRSPPSPPPTRRRRRRIARGLGISFTVVASARLYDRQGIVYVPITDRPRNYTALAWNPARLSREADALVRHVRDALELR